MNPFPAFQLEWPPTYGRINVSKKAIFGPLEFRQQTDRAEASFTAYVISRNNAGNKVVWAFSRKILRKKLITFSFYFPSKFQPLTINLADKIECPTQSFYLQEMVYSAKEAQFNSLFNVLNQKKIKSNLDTLYRSVNYFELFECAKFIICK